MHENDNKNQESFMKNLLKAAIEEIKSVSKVSVVMVLICAMVAVLGFNICVSNAKIQSLESDKSALSDKLSETEDKVQNLEGSLEASKQESAEKDDIIKDQQTAIKDLEVDEAERDKLVEDLKEQIGNLDLTGSAASRSDSEINDIKNGIAEIELLIRDVLGYTEAADEMITTLYDKVDTLQDARDRYPDRFPTEGVIGSPFGYRQDPIDNTITKFHSGVDIGDRIGAPIVSSGKGEVTFVGFEAGYGLYIIVNHGNGFETKYAHLNESLVNVGDFVNKGDLIATMGATGRVTGPHLHFEVVLNNQFQNPADYIL